MSQARNNRCKERRQAATREEKLLRNQIRNGLFPRWHLATEKAGYADVLERKVRKPGQKRKLTWRLVSTFKALMSLPPVEGKKDETTQEVPAPAVPSPS